VTDELTWDKPGAGQWTWDGTHLPGAPTPMHQAYHFPNMEAGLATVFERYGIPLRTFSFRMVNNKVYSRLLPLIGAEKEMTPPPKPILWAAVRAHPAFRRRNKAAAAAVATKRWRVELAEWKAERQGWIEANLALQDEDIAAYDNGQLADHLQRVFQRLGNGYRRHFELHGTDLYAIGDLIAHCEDWGISPAEAADVLRGSSPASTSVCASLASLGRLLAGAPSPPQTFDDIRALGPEAAGTLDEFLREYGWRMVTAYDIDGRALIEMPAAVIAAITSAGRRPSAAGAPDAGALRDRVPVGDRALFDDLITEARAVYDLRDDNGPIICEWPTGLLRRAMLEAGRRLPGIDENVTELSLDEVTSLLVDGTGPSPSSVSARAALRAEMAALVPPLTLGDPEPEPPLLLFPAPLARAVRVVIAAVSNIDSPVERSPMTGTGIGSVPYTGRARVAHCPEEALAAMEEGEVLVAHFTNPAYNALLFVAGAVVTEQGGPLSHTAVMARELAIPAVVGASGVMASVRDGDLVEVDPVRGLVRVL
jgi:rifampicin phosphotransferase